ncbi:MAG: L-threonylcarbamoyladenylate synthase [Treponema sp.]
MICRKSDKNSAALCARPLIEEKIIIVPTDTVYGFSGVVDKTADKIRRIKGRAEDKPFIILIAEPKDIRLLTPITLPQKLLAYWPGALTVIVPTFDGKSTVAVRCPGDEWLRSVIAQTGRPIYSTSVNRSGKPVLDTIDSIQHEFEEEVSLIVDDGDKTNAVPSTIVRYDGTLEIVRQGGVDLIGN